jgi:restriction system protein
VLTGVLWWRRRQRRLVDERRRREVEIAQSYEIARYYDMGPKDFEHALALLCRRDGCTGVQVVGGAGDLGADVIALAPDGRRIVLQAKRYAVTSKVVGPDLQRFGGTCFTVHRAGVAAVVTTSTFTRQAREYASHVGIHLFDQHRLAAWASRTGPAPWH